MQRRPYLLKLRLVPLVLQNVKSLNSLAAYDQIAEISVHYESPTQEVNNVIKDVSDFLSKPFILLACRQLANRATSPTHASP